MVKWISNINNLPNWKVLNSFSLFNHLSILIQRSIYDISECFDEHDMCDQYYGNEGYNSQFCGDHDYEDFTAKTDCCACKEGFTPPGKWIKHNICLLNQIQ